MAIRLNEDGQVRLIGASKIEGEYIARYAKSTLGEYEQVLLKFIHDGLVRAKAKRKGGDTL